MRFVGLEVVCILAHLFGQRVLYRDFKPSNLLLDGDGTLQLCDLGAAARVPGHGRSTLVGSPAYLAPEAVAITHLALQQCGAGYSTPADVWSAGIVLVELLSGSLAFPASPLDAAAQPSAILFRPPALEPAFGSTSDQAAKKSKESSTYSLRIRTTWVSAASAYHSKALPASPLR